MHLIQSLDELLFQQYKYYYAKSVNTEICLDFLNLCKYNFLRSIQKIHKETFKSCTIHAGFANQDIYLFKLSKILNILEQQIISIQDIDYVEGLSSRDSAVPISLPVLLLLQTFPKTLEGLQYHITRVKQDLEQVQESLDSINPYLSERIEHIFQDDLIQAELNTQQENIMDNLLRANRYKNKQKSYQTVQAKEIMTVKDTNCQIQLYELKEIEKHKIQIKGENGHLE